MTIAVNHLFLHQFHISFCIKKRCNRNSKSIYDKVISMQSYYFFKQKSSHKVLKKKHDVFFLRKLHRVGKDSY